MYSMAAPHAKGKSAEDNIFAANNRAIALAEKIGTENVVNATVGSILDEDGSLVVLDAGERGSLGPHAEGNVRVCTDPGISRLSGCLH